MWYQAKWSSTGMLTLIKNTSQNVYNPYVFNNSFKMHEALLIELKEDKFTIRFLYTLRSI